MNNIFFGKKLPALKVYKREINKTFDLLSLQNFDIIKYPYLLESSSRGNSNNRYSILFYKPEFSIEKNTNNFLDELDEYWLRNKIDQEKLVWKDKSYLFRWMVCLFWI